MTKTEIVKLRGQLEAARWRLGPVCVELGLSLTDVRAELAETEEGRELLAEIERRRPRSGMNVSPKHTLRGMSVEVQAAQKAHAAGKGESWSAWVLRVTEAARARGE